MKLALPLIFSIVLIAGCVGQQGYSAPEFATITIETATLPVAVQAEIADSEQERATGLMNRASLAPSAGMLFVFEDGEQTRHFWMKNTLVPLDILFISAEKKVVDIQTMVPCATEPCPLYTSRAHSAYALEVNAGFALENGVNVGDVVSWR